MPKYDFTRLSPQDFEELVRDLLQAEWKVPLEAFKSGRDDGIDLRYAPAHGVKTIIQCKHFAASGYTKLLAHLKKSELPKVNALQPDRYVVATTVGLNSANKEAITEVMRPFVQQPGDILGRADIEGLLSRHPQVERANFKLWLTSTEVITRVLHSAEQCHTDFEVDRVVEKLPLFVQSGAYPHAQNVLSTNRILVISGVPGIGKTTLAEMLLYAHLEQGYEPVVIQADIKEGRKLFRKDRKQIFYFDDFLGQTFFRDRCESSGINHDAALVDFIQMIERTPSSRFILTTREHLLQSAAEVSERLRHSTLLDHKCVLELSDYSTRQRARILYNHLFFSDLPRTFKEQILHDNFFLKVIKHEHFSPRIIEWMSASKRLRSVSSATYQKHVEGLLADPRAIWSDAFNNQLSQGARSLLLALYSVGGWTELVDLEPVWAAMHKHRADEYNFTTDPRDFNLSLKELDNAFLSYSRSHADFLNPSIQEFVAAEISAYPANALDIIHSAIRFKQIMRICKLARADTNTLLLQTLSTQVDMLIANMNRLMAADYLRWGRDENGKLRGTFIDIAPESRISNVAEMAEHLKSQRLLQYLISGIEALVRKYAEDIDHSDAARLLKSLEELPWVLDQGGRELQRNLLNAALRDLNGAHSQSFNTLLDCKQKIGCWTEADTALLMEAINDYRWNGVDEEIRRWSGDESMLESLRMDLETLGEKLDISFASDIERIDGELAEIPDKPRPSAGSGFARSGAPDTDDDNYSDDELKALFGTLLDPE